MATPALAQDAPPAPEPEAPAPVSPEPAPPRPSAPPPVTPAPAPRGDWSDRYRGERRPPPRGYPPRAQTSRDQYYGPPPPAPREPEWWETHTYQPSGSADARVPLLTSGGILLGLGGLTLLGSGLAWIVGASAATSLDDECPDRRCVIGTRGEDVYLTARDSDRAASIMVAIGLPMLAAGVTLQVLAIGTDKPRETGGLSLKVGPTGGAMEVTF